MKNKATLLVTICLLFAIFPWGLSAQTEMDTIITFDPETQTEDTTIVERKPPPPPSIDIQAFSLSEKKGGTLVIHGEPKGTGVDTLLINGESTPLFFENGQANWVTETGGSEKGELVLMSLDKKYRSYGDYRMYHVSAKNDKHRIAGIPLWLSIMPPLIAIILALIFREVVTSLFLGVVSGAFIINGMRLDSLYWFFVSILESLSNFIVNTLTDGGHISVIVFSILIGGMVALISRNGGMAGVVQSLSSYARSARSSQFITWLLGVAIFFDDYANTLIVGNTMRSVTDKYRISREKLAYIVDSTAAPVSAVAFITTWIGAELGYIDSGIQFLEGFDTSMSAYSIFLASLKYSFYPILTLAFILIIIFLKKDYGPMLKAEIRARTTGQVSKKREKGTTEIDLEDLDPVEGAPLRWYNAVIPVLTVILMTLFGLADTGMNSSYSGLVDSGVELKSSSWSETWSNLQYFSLTEAELAAHQAGNTSAPMYVAAQEKLADVSFGRKLGILTGNSDSYVALLWASLSGVLMALFLTLIGRIMDLEDSINTMLAGFKTMLPALIILALAWALADITGAIHTKDFLTSALTGKINPYLLPVIIFVLSALIAFSTGSSWSTMAILYPIAIPATWEISLAAGVDPAIAMELLLNVIAVVLAASVLGDHCSPISDTTILSSLASNCNHIDHVRTQLPYALTVGVFSLICGGVSTLLGGGWLISFILILISLAAMFGIVNFVGKRAE